MHGLPCSSLGHCFGNPSDVNTDPATVQEPNISNQRKDSHGPPVAPVTSQPEARPSNTQDQQTGQPQRTVSCISTPSTRTRNVNGTNSNSIGHLQDTDDDFCLESPALSHSVSQSSEDGELDLDCSPELEQYPHIPRPSIIIIQHKVRSQSVESITYTAHYCIVLQHFMLLCYTSNTTSNWNFWMDVIFILIIMISLKYNDYVCLFLCCKLTLSSLCSN